MCSVSIILGFDPGGKGRFGWCIASNAASLPIEVVDTGLADDAASAIEQLRPHLPNGERVLAAGIDAPLFWPRGGSRKVDQLIRDAIAKRGAKSPGGTVQHVNSLRGACLVQGILVAVLLREQFPSVAITEAHPKALLHLLDAEPPLLWPDGDRSEHERDAGLGVLGAWALLHHPPEWEDLLPQEDSYFSPLAEPLAYWMPKL